MVEKNTYLIKDLYFLLFYVDVVFSLMFFVV